MKSPFLFKFENVTGRLRDQWIFPGTNWEVAEGEHWTVLGPNGAGKSSLMRLILGEIPAVKGWIRRGYNPDTFKLGYVSFELQDWFLSSAEMPGTSGTALDILHHGSEADLESPEAAAMLKRLELNRHLLRDVRSLSTGEMRRLLIARALLKSPGLLILDEPFSGLDPEARQATAGMICGIASAGTQLIMVTNRPEEILPCTTRIACVRDCRIIRLGPRGILDEVTLSELYGLDRGPSNPLPEVRNRTGNPRSSRPLIKIKKAVVSYGGRTVLNGIDWTIRRGEHWAVVGPNGSGKSTLLNLITGENLQGYANEIYLFGRRKGSGETVWEIKRRIGSVSSGFQFAYRKETTVHDAVASGFFDSSGLYRIIRPSQERKTAGWMRLLGIAHLADKPFGRLSLGEKRMVMIARAVVKDPLLLLLDEPCSGLDLANRKRISELIEMIAAGNRTVIVYVTHHPEEMPACITHVLRLDRAGKGQIISHQNFPGPSQGAAS